MNYGIMTVLAHSLFKIAIHAQNPLKFSGIAQISKTFTISAHSGFPAGRQSETRRRRELIGQFGKVWFWTEPFPTALHLPHFVLRVLFFVQGNLVFHSLCDGTRSDTLVSFNSGREDVHCTDEC